jgi:voltage-gated sodium channel
VQAVDRIVRNSRFQGFILIIIALNAVAIGAETYPEIVVRHGALLERADTVFLTIFAVEIGLRLLAYGRRPRDFFRSGWNVFDFVIVVAALLPALLGTGVTVLRVLRIVRVFRLFSAFSELRTIITGMIRSLVPLAGVGFLMLLITYVYAIIGVALFGRASPEEWGQVGPAALSVFRILTLENWDDLYFAVAEVGSVATIYFVSFIIFATLVVLNLVIAVFVSSVERTRTEELAEETAEMARTVGERAPELAERIAEMRKALDQLEQNMSETVIKASQGRGPGENGAAPESAPVVR